MNGVDGGFDAAGAIDVAEIHEAVVILFERVEHGLARHFFLEHDDAPSLDDWILCVHGLILLPVFDFIGADSCLDGMTITKSNDCAQK